MRDISYCPFYLIAGKSIGQVVECTIGDLIDRNGSDVAIVIVVVVPRDVGKRSRTFSRYGVERCKGDGPRSRPDGTLVYISA